MLLLRIKMGFVTNFGALVLWQPEFKLVLQNIIRHKIDEIDVFDAAFDFKKRRYFSVVNDTDIDDHHS